MKKLSFAILLLLLAQTELWSQGCSMCTATAGALSEDKAEGLNTGIIYLALMPITLILSIGIWWYKKSKSAGTL